MKITTATSLRASMRLSALLYMLPAVVLAQAQSESPDTRISPIAMSANVPGLEITANTINRWSTQTELSSKQVESLGLVQGKLEEKDIRKLLLSADDSPARRYADFFDGIFGKPQDRADARNWKSASTFEVFIKDAVRFGGFDRERERELRDALTVAATAGDGPDQVKARGTAYRLLSEARQAALKTARSYRQLVDLLKRELESREFAQNQNIGLVIEVRTSAKQPTLSPVSIVTMECGPKSSGSAPTLVFAQRKRECNDQGVCRIESIAETNKGREYRAVFEDLWNDGRTYLDGCLLNTKMLIDGVEINRVLPGKFTSHTAPASP